MGLYSRRNTFYEKRDAEMEFEVALHQLINFS